MDEGGWESGGGLNLSDSPLGDLFAFVFGEAGDFGDGRGCQAVGRRLLSPTHRSCFREQRFSLRQHI
nr:hypothetical protein CFP56_23826 [Quercus suber]